MNPVTRLPASRARSARRRVVYGGDRQFLELVVLRIECDADGVVVGKERLRHVARHSPDGFEWGYAGSGPADLALAILTDAVGAEVAEDVYQHFKHSIVAHLPHDVWTIGADEVQAWVAFHTEPFVEVRR